MKEKLKNQNGVAFLAVILVIIIAVVAGGTTYLGVRMLITGDSFFEPFKELGWISLDENDKEDVSDSNDEEVTDSEKVSGSVKEERLSEEAKKSDTVHYSGKMTMADSEDVKADEEYADLYKLLTLEADVYARNNQAVEIVFTINMKEFLEGAYELYKDEMTDSGYENYEDFEKDMIPVFEKAFDFGYSEASSKNDSDIYDYIEKYEDDAVIQVYITEKGFDALYETYGIGESDENITDIINALEESIGITLKKVK